MSRPLCFISAPYAAPTAAEVRRNVARAAAVARLAHAHGYTPITPHLNFALLFGGEDDPESRAAAMELCLSTVRTVATTGGAFWALLRDDGTMSPGMCEESEAWQDAGGGQSMYSRWQPLRHLFAQHGDLVFLHDDPGSFWTSNLLRS